MTILYQLLATSIISYVCIILGIMYTLPSSTLKLFSSENTTLNRIMTETELSLMGSISSASTIIIMPFCGYILDTLGRKRTVMLFYLPQLIGWVLLVSIFKVEAFIFTMFLCGLSGSIFLVVPIYIGEYSDPCIRGAMVSSSIVFHGLGMVISYIIGGVLDYNTFNYIGLSMALIGLILLCFLKESPMHLMKKGFEEEALNSIAYYKGAKPNSTEVIKEKENMRSLLNADITLDSIPKEEKIPIWKALAKSQSTRRSLFGLLIILTLCIFQGLVVLQILAEPLFEAIISIMSPTLSSVLFGIITVGAGFIGAYLIDTAGRRLLLIASSIATGFFSAILGTQIDLNWGPNWLSAVLIYLYSITFTIGPASIPLVLVSEIFLPEIKSFATMVFMEWAFTCNFVILFIVNPLINTYGLGPLFYFFAGFSFLTAIFSFIYLPETKGLPADIIQLKFLEQKGYNTVTFK